MWHFGPTMSHQNANWGVVGLACLLLSACGGADEGAADGISSLGDDDGAEADMGDEAGDDDSGDGPLLDIGAGSDLPGQEECASVDAAAEAKKLPADILVVVDNSGSMDDEVAQVQAQLNGFSQQIIGSGVDVRVILMSSYPGDGNGICIEPPLGSGGCPNQDTNAPTFVHIDERIGSSNALSLILQDADQWGAWMRPEATTHIFVVTDDESNLGGQSFLDSFYALSPDYTDLRFHGVVSLQNCAFAADIGDTYEQLALQTGGIIADLCDQDFAPVFQELSTAVIGGSLLPCEFEIPPPPEGETFDPDQVNVEFSDGVDSFPIGRVEDVSECALVADGWYYDDPVNPTAILMCEQTCSKFQNLEQANLQILFGCETMPAG